jgi:NAD(P)-dependent dehydrogenase (short-subunit alcohol dehydrogenase family)
MSLDGKHAIVTGGGTGVGAEIAAVLAHAGAKVTIFGRRQALLEEIAGKHDGISWVVCDVTDAEAVTAAFAEARQLNGAVSIVVANAGAAESRPFAKMTAELMQDMLSVNLIGVMNVWQAALPDMKKNEWGRMIAIASTAGLKGYPYTTAYCAAKHGVVGMTRALSLELGATGVTANAICPSFVETPMLDRAVANIIEKTGQSEKQARAALLAGNPQKKFVQTDEVAGAALWLCSDGARSTNGHTLTLSGGEI